MTGSERKSDRRTQAVFAALKGDLMRWRFAPNARLTMRRLADEQGVSEAIVRLALHTLAEQGWVERAESGGFIVPTPTAETFAQMYQASRDALDHELAGIERLPDDVARLGGDFANGAASASPERRAEAIARLLEAIAQLSAGRYHARTVRDVNEKVHFSRTIDHHIVDDAGALPADLAEALSDRDVEALRTRISTFHDRRILAANPIVEDMLLHFLKNGAGHER